MGLLAEEVHKREAGKLPSYPTLNPKHKPGGPEHVNMVPSLRNGKTYNNDIKIPSVHDFSHDVHDFVNDDEIVVQGKKDDNMKSDFDLPRWGYDPGKLFATPDLLIRSSSRLARDQSSNPTSSTNPNPKGRNRRCSKQRIETSILEEQSHLIVTMTDNRTMAELLRALTEGYAKAIVPAGG
nr:hypothetical protein [Tanacetum cinerariifolium]